MKGTEKFNSHDMLLSNEETFRFETCYSGGRCWEIYTNFIILAPLAYSTGTLKTAN